MWISPLSAISLGQQQPQELGRRARGASPPRPAAQNCTCPSRLHPLRLLGLWSGHRDLWSAERQGLCAISTFPAQKEVVGSPGRNKRAEAVLLNPWADTDSQIPKSVRTGGIRVENNVRGDQGQGQGQMGYPWGFALSP